MKKTLIIIILCLFEISAFAQSTHSEIENIIYQETDIKELADNNDKISSVIPDFSFEDLTKDINKGKSVITPETIIHSLFKMFTEEISVNFI